MTQADLTVAGGSEEAPRPTSASLADVSAPPTRARGVRGMSVRARQMIVAAVFVGIVLLTAGGLVVLAMTQEEPGWWDTQATYSDTQSFIVAQNLENGIVTLLTSARPPNDSGDPTKPWTVGLKSAEANAWLNTRLQKWLENQNKAGFKWPRELDEIRVEFDHQRIYVGARIRSAGQDQVLSAVLAPEFREDGSLWIPAEVVTLGRLGVPAKWVLGSASSEPIGSAVTNVPEAIANMPQTRVVLAAFAGQNAVMREPTIRLGDGRRVRVLALQSKDGRLLITCQTVQRETATAR